MMHDRLYLSFSYPFPPIFVTLANYLNEGRQSIDLCFSVCQHIKCSQGFIFKV